MAEAAVKTEPKGEHVSLSEFARRVKLDKVTTKKRLEDLGHEPDPELSGPKLSLYWYDEEIAFAVKSAKDTISAMKIRELRARAEKLEMANAEAKRELVKMSEVVEIVQKIGVAIHQEFTVRQPKRVASSLARTTNVAAVKKILKADTEKVMKQLRVNFGEFIS